MRTGLLSQNLRSSADRVAALLKRWPKLTLEDIEIAGDDRTLLIFTIMSRYELAWEKASRAFAVWEAEYRQAAPSPR